MEGFVLAEFFEEGIFPILHTRTKIYLARREKKMAPTADTKSVARQGRDLSTVKPVQKREGKVSKKSGSRHGEFRFTALMDSKVREAKNIHSMQGSARLALKKSINSCMSHVLKTAYEGLERNGRPTLTANAILVAAFEVSIPDSIIKNVAQKMKE